MYQVINGIEVYAVLNIGDKIVMEMLKPFSIFMTKKNCTVSTTIWKHHADLCLEGGKVSLAKVAKNVWDPCLEEICQLVEKFSDKSISLEEIDYYFKDILPENLQHEVLTLVEGYNKYYNIPALPSLVPEFTMSVSRYKIVSHAKGAAEVVLGAKHALMLTGNFEILTGQVSYIIIIFDILTTFARSEILIWHEN